MVQLPLFPRVEEQLSIEDYLARARTQNEDDPRPNDPAACERDDARSQQ